MNISKTIIIIIILSVAVPFFLHAQQKNTVQKNVVSQKRTAQMAPKPDATIAVTEEEVNLLDVQEVVNEVIDKLKKEKEKDPVPATLVMSYANSFTDLSKLSRIETDTRISVGWYKNVSESLSKLAEIKLLIEVAALNKDEEQLKELKKIYTEFVARIIYLLEHPQKLSEKK
jgi:hypothetical protein